MATPALRHSEPQVVSSPSRRRLALLATVVVGLSVAACNSLLGNEQRTLDDFVVFEDEGGAAADAGVDTSVLNPVDNPPVDAAVVKDAPSGDADAGLRMPDPTCVKTSAMVTSNAVRRVEEDTSPAPIVTASTVTASFSIFGDNALSNVHLSFCTPDGLIADVGGGTNFLGGGGAVTRHWQTKNVTAVPVGRVQAQVYSDSPAVLRYITNLDLF